MFFATSSECFPTEALYKINHKGEKISKRN